MEKGPFLRKQLITEILAHHSAFHVLRSFNDTYRRISERNLVPLRRLFLCTAIKYEHTALLILLLSKPKFRDLDSQMDYNVPRPLFVAIDTGNVSLVDAFLRAGSRVSRLEETEPETVVLKHVEMSAIEYACVADHPDILKLLVSYEKNETLDKDKTLQRGTPLHYACDHGAYKCIEYLIMSDDCSKDINTICCLHGNRWVTPLMLSVKHGLRVVRLLLAAGASAAVFSKQTGSALHAVMGLCNKWYDKEELSDVCVVVELLLNAGACVEKEDISSDTALYQLISQIDESKCAGVEIAARYCSMTIEVARKLLVAGSPSDSKVLEHLLRLMKSYKPSRLLDLPYAQMRRNLHHLISQLFDIILKHQTDRLLTYANECYYEVLILNVAGLVEKLAPILGDCGYLNGLYNNIIDFHSEMFRCLMLAGAGADIVRSVGTVVFSNSTIRSDVFVNAFIKVAGYSSQSGRTTSFARMILNALNTTQVDMLLRILSARQMFATDSAAEGTTRTFINEAVELLRTVQSPPCLKHLSRRAITRCFPNEVLTAEGVETLGLPKDLAKYLLLLRW